MPYSQPSDTKYLDQLNSNSPLEPIPVAGPDSANLDRNWDQADKLEAAEVGEATVEARVNDGAVIGTPTVLHAEAAAAYATYRLVVGLKAPDAATRGDASDEGDERMAFAREVRSMYEDAIETIQNSGADEGTVAHLSTVSRH